MRQEPSINPGSTTRMCQQCGKRPFIYSEDRLCAVCMFLATIDSKEEFLSRATAGEIECSPEMLDAVAAFVIEHAEPTTENRSFRFIDLPASGIATS